jgi:hypothetical protein
VPRELPRIGFTLAPRPRDCPLFFVRELRVREAVLVPRDFVVLERRLLGRLFERLLRELVLAERPDPREEVPRALLRELDRRDEDEEPAARRFEDDDDLRPRADAVVRRPEREPLREPLLLPRLLLLLRLLLDADRRLRVEEDFVPALRCLGDPDPAELLRRDDELRDWPEERLLVEREPDLERPRCTLAPESPSARARAVERAISLLKLLFCPRAVVSWCSNASPRSSNFWNQSSHEISSSEFSPLYPGKSRRRMPISPSSPVPRTHDGRAPRSSAQRRISSWSVVTLPCVRDAMILLLEVVRCTENLQGTLFTTDATGTLRVGVQRMMLTYAEIGPSARDVRSPTPMSCEEFWLRLRAALCPKC